MPMKSSKVISVSWATGLTVSSCRLPSSLLSWTRRGKDCWPCQAVVSCCCFLQLGSVCSSASRPKSFSLQFLSKVPSLCNFYPVSLLWTSLPLSCFLALLDPAQHPICLFSEHIHWFIIPVSVFAKLACSLILFTCYPSLSSLFLLLQLVSVESSCVPWFSFCFKTSHFPTPRFPLSSAAVTQFSFINSLTFQFFFIMVQECSHRPSQLLKWVM